MRLHATKFGLTLGIMWGAAIFFGTLWLLMTGSGGNTWHLLSNFYIGFRFSVLGAFIGLIWGFVDGFLGGWIFALIYNAFVGKPAKIHEPVLQQPEE